MFLAIQLQQLPATLVKSSKFIMCVPGKVVLIIIVVVVVWPHKLSLVSSLVSKVNLWSIAGR